MTIDTTDLRRLAEAARAQTSDAWCVVRYGDGDSLVIHYDADNRVCFMATPGRNYEADMARITGNAAYIAAASPSVVLALLDRLERAEAVARERGRLAADVDCGCAARQDVLARLAEAGERSARNLCTHGDVCCALQAAAIRARGGSDE